MSANGSSNWRRRKSSRQNRLGSQNCQPMPLESMFFNYRLKGGDDTIRPVRVFDDGKETYIQISAAAKNREAPVLVVIGADGKQEMVNYRVKDDMYIVDRLFERAELILGSGKKARKVEIDRERKS